MAMATVPTHEVDVGPLEGKLVTIVGAGESDAHGRAIAWDPAQDKYLVETFSGTRTEVRADELTEYEQADADDGGFDMAWPLRSAHGHAIFSFMVAESLKRKGYCYIQMFGNDDARESMTQTADARNDDYTRPKKEFEEAYLGKDPQSKVAWIEGERATSVGLEYYNQYLKDMHLMLLPVAHEFLDFLPWSSRMGTLIRRSYADSKEEQLLDTGEIEEIDITEGAVEKHIEFMQRRRLCMFYLVECTGGIIELTPKERSDYERVLLKPARDRFLIFRHDEFSYTYESEDSSDIVLQSWIVDPPSQLQLTKLNGEIEEVDDETKRGPIKPPGPGVLTFITSLMARMAGDSYGDGAQVWPTFCTNVDGYIEIPNGRFDLDFYYDPNGDFGKTRTKHSALVSDTELQLFDPEFFQWTDEEAQNSSACLRLVMDAGFEVMYRAGLSRDELFGQRIGYYLGHTCDGESAAGFSAPMRLNYFLGTTGRASIIDTACSSALVSCCMAHQDIACGRACAGVIAGVGVLLDVRPYIAMSSGRMISSRGRSHTFDHSADGYGRGEGVAACFLEDGRENGKYSKLRQSAMMKEPMELARFAASAMNQDGRSASITAPSGPAQTACIKASLKECGLAPNEVIFGECHGTGTALGDPIEVGSSRMVNDPYTREIPLNLGAAKTQVGHLELGAGAVGALRTVCLLVNATVPPNCHCGQLNEHFSLEGFPVTMPMEALHAPHNANNVGVNSFGFGGTNARCELWGKHLSNIYMDPEEKALPKLDKLNYITVPCPRCLGPMCWLCGIAIPKSAAFRGKHHCSAVRDEFAKYEYCSNCYDGGYKHGTPDYQDVPNPGGLKVYINGSWSLWESHEEMAPDEEEEGKYSCVIRLGDTRRETFRIVVDMDPNLTLYPSMPKGNSVSRIMGPDYDYQGLSWEINGEEDDMPEGTLYRVTFTWPDSAEVWKTISWEPTEELLPNLTMYGPSKHSYSIMATWSKWQLMDMTRHPLEWTLWEIQVRVGPTGKEEFRFARDKDLTQAIYPANTTEAEEGVPVMGPDNAAEGRSWVIHEKAGTVVAVRIQCDDGKYTVTTAKHDGERTWRSSPRQYYVLGTWTGDQLQVMEADATFSCKYKSWMVVGPECREEFQIIEDQDPGKRIHPVSPNAPPGQALHAGPDAKDDLWWEILGRPGQEFEISLDFNAEDRRRVVHVTPYVPDDGSAAPVGFAQLTN